ncbi:MAG: tRNA (adenosine(37)-N6)-threonylcarbamoyltransferase complex dimerization subunit type 1 TsaB [Acidimicrobiales bacterium]|nr:tRNA (adenosine(37)-N6)-threonylcarbamoyltransferase complex dimerization subunit type 1 TsaB [Acidimicrobiales bacterium]
MVIVGIESSTSKLGVGILRDGEMIAISTLYAPRRHVESIIPLLRNLLEASELQKSDIELIALDVGPGLFTGLRVGVVTAKTLAAALKIKIVPVNSLEAMASQFVASQAPLLDKARKKFHQHAIVPVIDGRRGEIYHAGYSSDMRETLWEQEVSKPELLLNKVSGLDVAYVFGSGYEKYKEELNNGFISSESFPLQPSVETLCQIAYAGAIEPLEPRYIAPLYLRPPDTAIGWSSRASKH